jgi:hypothetical protein
MSTATRRVASRKAMRVATVFTGAAATAVAFAPTALAAPGHAPTRGHTALVNGKTRAVRPDVDSGSIKSKGCGSSDVHWLHIQYESLFQRKLCKAFGFRGVKLVSQDFSAECGGNNHGTIFWNTGSLPFGPGNTYRSVTRRNISAVSILFWSGTDQCRWPR